MQGPVGIVPKYYLVGVPCSMLQRHMRRSRSTGQSLVELALVLPVLCLLLMTVLQIGFMLFTQVGLTNAAREAARNASAIPVTTPAQALTAANTYYARLTDPVNGFLTRNVGGYNPGRLIGSASPSPHTVVCYYSFTDASLAPAVMARVEVEYSHPLFIPLVSNILDGFDGASDGGFRLGATEDIRVGNAILTATTIGAIGSPTCNA
jgi:Flp pilus assembly protein TadG